MVYTAGVCVCVCIHICCMHDGVVSLRMELKRLAETEARVGEATQNSQCSALTSAVVAHAAHTGSLEEIMLAVKIMRLTTVLIMRPCDDGGQKGARTCFATNGGPVHFNSIQMTLIGQTACWPDVGGMRVRTEVAGGFVMCVQDLWHLVGEFAPVRTYLQRIVCHLSVG